MTKTRLIILGVLGLVILASLAGIGILGRKFLSGTTGTEEAITLPQATPTLPPEATATLIPAPSLTEPAQTPAPSQTEPAQPPAPPLPQPTQPLVPVQTPLVPIQTPLVQPLVPIETVLAQPMAVYRQEGTGPFAVAVLVGVPLQPGHRYRLEVSSRAGTVGFHGSWSQSALGADGAPGVDTKPIEGVTPANYDIVPPVANPILWKCSASVQNKGVGGIILTVWDVTGSTK